MRIFRAEPVLHSESDGEIVLLHADKGASFSLTHTGAFIWQKLDTGPSLEQLVDAVTEEYDFPAEACRTKVEAFIQSLLKEELVELGQ